MTQDSVRPAPASGRLGVLVVGMGALSTALIAGVLAVRRGLGKPVGALTQMGRVAGPPGHPDPVPLQQAVPLASLQDLAFGGWDILPDDVYHAADHVPEILELGLPFDVQNRHDSSLPAACAAAKRAMGTRCGEHET